MLIYESLASYTNVYVFTISILTGISKDYRVQKGKWYFGCEFWFWCITLFLILEVFPQSVKLALGQ